MGVKTKETLMTSTKLMIGEMGFVITTAAGQARRAASQAQSLAAAAAAAAAAPAPPTPA